MSPAWRDFDSIRLVGAAPGGIALCAANLQSILSPGKRRERRTAICMPAFRLFISMIKAAAGARKINIIMAIVLAYARENERRNLRYFMAVCIKPLCARKRGRGSSIVQPLARRHFVASPAASQSARPGSLIGSGRRLRIPASAEISIGIFVAYMASRPCAWHRSEVWCICDRQ